MKKYFENQFLASLKMFQDTVENYPDELWFNDVDFKSPAWQIAYHNAFFANIYMSASPNRIKPWKEIEWVEDLARKFDNEKAYSQADMLNFISHLQDLVPLYLKDFSSTSPCWPDWYDLSQLEFQINNLRHIQHHNGQLIERLQTVEKVLVNWQSFQEIPNN